MNKNKTLSLLLPLAALFVIASCHDDDNHPSMKEHTRYTISTEPSSLKSFAAKGEKQTIKVTAKKIVETFLGDTHQKDKDVISNAEFTVKTEGEGFSQEIKDSTITVTANENTENTVRKGTLTITIKEDDSKFIKLELTQLGQEVGLSNVLDLFAEFNLEDLKVFAKSHDTDKSGYYTFDEAKTSCPEGYHLPSRDEWKLIIPAYNFGKSARFDKETLTENIKERIKVGGVIKDYKADYIGTTKNISYGLKFKDSDNKMLTAFRYQIVDLQSNNLNAYLKISARHIGNSGNHTSIRDIANEAYWKENNKYDVSRIFPACGTYYMSQLNNRGTWGFYWSSEIDDNSNAAWYWRFNSEAVNDAKNMDFKDKYSVRCIKDTK